MVEAILVTVLLGALVGWLASIVMNRNSEQGAVENILVGVVGAFLGGLLSRLFGGEGADFWIGFNLADVFWAFVGAVVLCALLNYKNRGRVR